MEAQNLSSSDRAIHHDVYAMIVEWIHRGELLPGDRVSEAAIARQLGISRGPVREAISRLDHEGLIVRRPRRGPMVPEFTPKDLADVISVRELIEGFAARSACARVQPQDLDELQQLIDNMYRSIQDEEWTKTALLNSEFHSSVVRMADNNVLSKVWQVLHPLAWLLAATPPQTPNRPQDPESTVIRHRTLVDALASGDPERAETAFREHVVQATQTTLSSMRHQSDGEQAENREEASTEPSQISSGT